MTPPRGPRSWEGDGRPHRELLLAPTGRGDDWLNLGVRGLADGIGIRLSPQQVAELRDELDARLSLMRQGVRA